MHPAWRSAVAIITARGAMTSVATASKSARNAAARTWSLGTTLTVTSPKNGRTLTVRINDTGPWGIAYAKGARLDLARGAAQRLGMTGTQYICVS